MFYIYILQSLQDENRFYVGFTEDLKRRLKEHNSGYSIHTNKFMPWKIKSYFAFDDKNITEKFERYLKTQSGRNFQKKHF